MSKGRKRLGDLLIEAGLLSGEQLEKALKVQKKTDERLGRILLNLGYITEESMIEVLEFQLGVPHVDLAAMPVDKEIAAAIPVSLAERYQVIPVSLRGRKLKLAMVDPTNFYAIDGVRMVTGYDIDPVIATEREIMRAISQSYGVQELVEKAVNNLKPEDVPALAQIQTTDDAPIVGIVNSLFSRAVRERASDIHIEPQNKVLRVRFRIDGVLRDITTFTKELQASVVSRIKIMADMDIAEKRLPQDGRIRIQEAGREIDVRVSTLPTILGEKIVMRILDKKAVILDLEKLGFSALNLHRYQQLFTQSYGMILVTGPTGLDI